MQEKHTWASISQHRANLYQWFAAVFAQELSQAQFQAYCQGQANDLFALFNQLGLAEESKRVQLAIQQLMSDKEGYLNLKSDFAHLFLLDGKEAALPYASYYLEKSKTLYGQSEARMRAFLSESGLQMDQEFKEPADHLSIYLSLISQWAQQDSEIKDSPINRLAQEQSQFLQDALQSWLPEMVQNSQLPRSLFSDFYPALCALLQAFVQEDIVYLQQVE